MNLERSSSTHLHVARRAAFVILTALLLLLVPTAPPRVAHAGQPPDSAAVLAASYAWHTFYGGTGDDEGRAVAVDANGNILLAGRATLSWNGPLPANAAPLDPYAAGDDCLVVKLNSQGAYQWHAFYGGDLFDLCTAVTTDAAGNIYVAGNSATSWTGPAPANTAPKHPFDTATDLFVLKLNSSGQYQWHTFYGGLGTDTATALVLAPDGSIYVSGVSYQGFTGVPAPQHNRTGGSDMMALKLTSAGDYVWHTFFGGGFDDSAWGIAVDASGSNVYLGGYSQSTWAADEVPAQPDARILVTSDLTLVKLTASGQYQWHEFFGAAMSNDQMGLVALDTAENVYLAGTSRATWNGPAPASTAPLNPHSGGGADIVALKVDAQGHYLWHTFYGGAQDESVYGIAADATGVYVSGYGASPWNGPAGVAPLNTHDSTANTDAFVLKLAETGQYGWHTFYGGAGRDYGYDGVADGSGDYWLTGYSYLYTAGAGWNGPPSGTTAPLNNYTALSDAFVVKMQVWRRAAVLRAGNGSGSVTSAPAGIDCGATCAAIYGYNASVTLTATPADDSVFAGWSGACSGTGACILTLDGAKNVTATFTIKPLYLPLLTR